MEIESEFQETLRSAQAGRRFALAALYRQSNPKIVYFLRAQAPGMGEDLAQETWLEAGSRLREFQGGSRDFSVWLLSLARQQLILYRQSAGLLPTTPLTPGELADAVDANVVADLRMSDVAVEQLLATLPPASREVILLRVIGGLNAHETGAVIGKSAGAVRVIQHRALRQLASRLPDDRTRR